MKTSIFFALCLLVGNVHHLKADKKQDDRKKTYENLADGMLGSTAKPMLNMTQHGPHESQDNDDDYNLDVTIEPNKKQKKS